mgnify:CR=1 FL=1
MDNVSPVSSLLTEAVEDPRRAADAGSDRRVGRSEDRSEGRSEDHPESRSEGRSGDRPESRSEGRRTGVTVLRWTTPPGLEEVSVAEARALLATSSATAHGEHRFEEKPLGLAGHCALATTAPAEAAEEVCRGMRSAYHLIRHRGHFTLGKPHEEVIATEIAAGTRGVSLPELEGGEHTFRVSCTRTGTHSFKSPDIEREVGSIVVERWNPPVDLEHYDVNLRIDIVEAVVLIGVQLTGEGMDKRYPWVYRPRVTLRTTIAYGMIALGRRALGEPPDTAALTAPPPRGDRGDGGTGTDADADAPGGRGTEAAPAAGAGQTAAATAGDAEAPGSTLRTLLDPFCGSGTIPIEAANLLPGARVLAADRDEEAVAGTRSNADATGVAVRIDLKTIDARDLDEHYETESVDAIVTNPPFGIRLHREADFYRLYRRFLTTAGLILRPRGVIVILVGKKRGLFNRVLREVGLYDLVEVRIIEIGGVYPGLFVLRKRE